MIDTSADQAIPLEEESSSDAASSGSDDCMDNCSADENSHDHFKLLSRLRELSSDGNEDAENVAENGETADDMNGMDKHKLLS